jgi:hypothetical protein
MAGLDRRLFQPAAHYQVELSCVRMGRREPEPSHRTICPAQRLRLPYAMLELNPRELSIPEAAARAGSPDRTRP